MLLSGRRGTGSRSTQGSLGPLSYFVFIRPSASSTVGRGHLVNSYTEPSHGMGSTHPLDKQGFPGIVGRAPKSLAMAVWMGEELCGI